MEGTDPWKGKTVKKTLVFCRILIKLYKRIILLNDRE